MDDKMIMIGIVGLILLMARGVAVNRHRSSADDAAAFVSVLLVIGILFMSFLVVSLVFLS